MAKSNISNNILPADANELKEGGGQIVLYQPDESISLEVKLDVDADTVWLNRKQISLLFGRDIKTIGKHINNALHEELDLDAKENQTRPVVAKFATTAADGKNYQVEYYSLDVILSVGYRVKSNRGIQFRRWANSTLKTHLLQGYSVNRQLIRSAKNRVILIDNYCDERTLTLLAKRTKKVECTIHTRYNESFKEDLAKHNRQYPEVKMIQLPHQAHDRFLILDDDVYILGDSIKDIGHSLTTVLKTGFTPDEILAKLR